MTLSSQPLRLAGVFVAVFAAVFVFTYRSALRDWITDVGKEPVPSAVAYPTVSASVADTLTPAPGGETKTPPMKTPPAVTREVNLDIPFVSQAPHKIWDAEHEEFCEEAATLMAASYIKGDRTVLNIDIAEAALQDAKKWEISTFGYFEDTTAAESARMLREHFGISEVNVVADPTEAQIKGWVADRKAVIVPSAGRMLGNPNFTGAGPLYHFVVVKGYTANGTFITNDAGTRKGAGYLYAPSVIMNAMHDWNGGDVNNGAKVVIVVG